MSRYRFALVGGDLRSARLGGVLEADGHSVCTFALEDGATAQRRGFCASVSEAVARADILIAPAPFTADARTLYTPLHAGAVRIEELVEAADRGKLLIGGRIPQAVQAALGAKGVRTEDIVERDDFAILNSVPTAEGAIRIAMEELPVTIRGLCVLVTGYGRVGRTLARTLAALGADVQVAVRSGRDAADAFAAGLPVCSYGELPDAVARVQLLYNTVPAQVVTRPVLERLPAQALVIDLASPPGGVDGEAADAAGVRVIRALALPGKAAPLTAARNMAEVIYTVIREQEQEVMGHA